MITETRFAKQYSSVWRGLAPTMELLVRKANAQLYARDWADLEAESPPGTRATVNRTAFRLVTDGSAEDGFNKIAAFIGDANNARAAELREIGSNVLTDGQIAEAIALSYRMATHFFVMLREPVMLEPRSAGCGMINSCRGDALTASGRIIELKDGDRPFRSYELRQLSCYAALYLNETGQIPSSIMVINSRRGVSVEVSMEDFAEEVAGQSAITYLREIIRVISDTTISG